MLKLCLLFSLQPSTIPVHVLPFIVSHRNLLSEAQTRHDCHWVTWESTLSTFPGAKLSTCMYGLFSSCYSGSCYLIVHLLLIWWPQTMKRNGILWYLYEPIWYFADANDSSYLYIGTWLFTIFSTLATEFAFLSQQWQWQNSQNIMNCWNCITSNI